MTKKNLPIKLKGSIFTLLVLYLKNNTVELIKAALYKKIKESPFFFKNAPIAVNVKELSHDVNWISMKQTIISLGFHIIGISGCVDPLLKNMIIKSGLPILSEGKKIADLNINKFISDKSKIYTPIKKKVFRKTKIFYVPIRSGQKIHAVNSDLIIINNINSGAEVISDGNIHVYGEVKGRILAGATGDITSQIFCTKFFAELISIAGEYLLIDQFFSRFIGSSVRIYIEDKKLKITKLN